MLEGIKAAASNGKPAAHQVGGDADAAIKAASKVIRAEYTLPLLSHSPLEPMNFTAWYHDNKVDLIGPTQWQDAAASTVAKEVGVPPENVSLRTTFLGGGFGRRIDLDFIVQAAQMDAYSKVTGAVDTAYNQTYEKVGELSTAAREQYDYYLEENPLAVGAVALALGAAVGFAIPSTRYEDQLLGETRARLVDQAGDKAIEFLDNSKAAIKDAVGQQSDAVM